MNPNKPVQLPISNLAGSKTDRLDARVTQLERAVIVLDNAMQDLLMQSGIVARFAKKKLGLDDATISELQNELALEQHEEKMRHSGFMESSEPLAANDCASVIAKASNDPYGVPALAEITDDEVSMVGLKVGDTHVKTTPEGDLTLQIVKIFKKQAANGENQAQ